MRALLDINVLIALLDAQHVHHAAAQGWLRESIADDGWTSCPLTQNGVVRIMSQPAYPGAQPAGRVAARLAEATQTRWHAFWPDDVSLLEPGTVAWNRVLASRQVTDLLPAGAGDPARRPIRDAPSKHRSGCPRARGRGALRGYRALTQAVRIGHQE